MTSKAEPIGRGMLREAEIASGMYSPIEVRRPREGILGCAIIAPPVTDTRTARSHKLPTVLAISGEEQMHVSRFFRAWHAERYGWQVVIPLRPKMGTHYLFEPPGLELVKQFVHAVLEDHEGEFLPFGIEQDKFHLVGSSNGGATVLALAAALPELVVSLTLVTGYIPDSLVDLTPLRALPIINLYVGDGDEMGHQERMEELNTVLQDTGVPTAFHLLEGAGHFNIGEYIDMASFWATLEGSRNPAITGS
jgi:predicted esterase